MNFRVPYNAGKFLSGCTIGSFSRKAQLHEWVSEWANFHRNYLSIPKYGYIWQEPFTPSANTDTVETSASSDLRCKAEDQFSELVSMQPTVYHSESTDDGMELRKRNRIKKLLTPKHSECYTSVS
jgi:hypothetical protein